MTTDAILEKLTPVFCDVFDDETIALSFATTAADVPGWDSLVHIRLIAAVEDEFGMRFDMKDVVSMQNVGEMVNIIQQNV